jgi:ribA/ribD-fused uncharacterized protein
MKIKDGFLLFWKTGDYMSNWHLSPFSVDGINFNCAEQWMMYSKAMLFGDTQTATAILKEPVPRNQKALGRKVKGFDSEIWKEKCFDILVKGCFQKFVQNPEMKKKILDTHELVLVEASPHDDIWGVGMDEDHPDITNPDKWLGLNLLGMVLMEVRRLLREQK